MNCNKAQQQISDLLDTLESKAMPESLRAHLDVCPKCAAELRAQQTLRRTLRTLSERHVPEHFNTQVMAQLPEASPRVLSPAWWHSRAIRWAAVPAAGLATLALWMGTRAPSPVPEAQANQARRACVQAYAQYRSQQSLGGSEMLVIASELDHDTQE